MSFLLLAHWNGRFGNRMHQYAYGATYSNMHSVDFILPSDWEGTHLFKTQYHKVLDHDNLRLHINQSSDYWHQPEKKKELITSVYPDAKFIDPKNTEECYKKYDHPVYIDDLCAYGDHIYEKMSASFLKEVFQFSDLVKNTESYKYWEARKGTYDVAHLRRDDISNPEYNKVNVQGYSVISKDSYYKAFEKYGVDKESIYWVSDDYLNKWHTDRPKKERYGWSYPVGAEYKQPLVFDWLEDFLTIYFARTVFRANSSFSWWACFLSPTAKIYSPAIDKQLIYGRDGLIEIDLDFVEGNTPHWMYHGDRIHHIDIK